VSVPESYARAEARLTGQIAEIVPMSTVDYDFRYTLEELRGKARQVGLSPSGSKKEIAAKLIAKGVT